MHLAQRHLFNVHEIDKEDMQNNICIIWSRTNAQNALLSVSHPYTRTKTLAPLQLRHRWLIARNNARYSDSGSISSLTSWTW